MTDTEWQKEAETAGETALRNSIFENGGVPLGNTFKPEQYRLYIGFLQGAQWERSRPKGEAKLGITHEQCLKNPEYAVEYAKTADGEIKRLIEERDALKAALKKAVDDLAFLEGSGHLGNIEASIVRGVLSELRPVIDSEQPQKEERK